MNHPGGMDGIRGVGRNPWGMAVCPPESGCSRAGEITRSIQIGRDFFLLLILVLCILIYTPTPAKDCVSVF